MAQVRIILREDVHGLGNAGTVVSVRPGYARNFLLPEGKAVLATVKVDPATFVKLSSLPEKGEKAMAYTIGYAVGSALVLAFVIYALMKARQRSRAT